ncbi:MAG: TlpA disulfide reductase family protein [Lachnospiraceae bacterium]
MNGKKKMTVFLIIFILFLVIASIFYRNLSKEIEPKSTKNTVEIVTAPDINIINYDGNKIKLSQMFGKPIVMNFWASWCPSCKSEMPYFNSIYEEKNNEITFMMVDLVDDKRETIETGTQLIEKEGYNFPVYFDVEQEAQRNYQVFSLPTTVFIDKNGQINSIKKGKISEENLRFEIDLISK